MLLNLHVKNFAIIDEIEVYFGDHLNIMTGETGAGKSIIIGSINVALGGKISKDIIRKGAEYALVELAFHTENEEVREKLKLYDLPLDDDGCIIITRKIMNNRSISKINGENVTANVLKDIASSLIDIHGQHEHQSLLYKQKHLDYVEQFAKSEVTPVKIELQRVFREYSEVKDELSKAVVDELAQLDTDVPIVTFMQKRRGISGLVDMIDVARGSHCILVASDMAHDLGCVMKMIEEEVLLLPIDLVLLALIYLQELFRILKQKETADAAVS